MRTAHLFAGAGGGLLADLILGHEPVLAVEWDAHACAVLRERAAEGWFPGLHVHEGDIRRFDFKPWARRVDCLAAGFPCQDVSAAGTGEGIDGARSGLVSEVWRAIDEISPPLVYLENSPHIRTKGRTTIIRKLLSRGYSWRDGVIGAADGGAGHQRDRWFCLAANAHGLRKLQSQRGFEKLWGWLGDGASQPGPNLVGISADQRCEIQTRQPEAAGMGEATADFVCHRPQGIGRPEADQAWCEEPTKGFEASSADTMCHRLQRAVQRGGLSETDAATIQAAARYVGAYDWAPPDAGVCRVVDGLANRMDRIKCAGNGQVPIQAAAAFMILSQSHVNR